MWKQEGGLIYRPRITDKIWTKFRLTGEIYYIGVNFCQNPTKCCGIEKKSPLKWNIRRFEIQVKAGKPAKGRKYDSTDYVFLLIYIILSLVKRINFM